MRSLIDETSYAFEWLVSHWKTISAIVVPMGGLLLYWFHFQKTRAEAGLAKLTLRKAELEEQTRSLGELLRIYADNERKKPGAPAQIAFAEEELRRALGERDAPRLHAVLALLEQGGKAKKAPFAGHWYID